MSRRRLQLLNARVGLATVALGGMQLALGSESPIYAGQGLPAAPILGSNLRFFGGMDLGLGLVLLWILPAIERHGALLRAVWICARLGGPGRLASVAALGAPRTPLVAFTVLEVVCAPLFPVWQARLARAVAGG